MAGLDLDPDDEVIVYCDCPNDASAALMAAKLRKEGFRRVRPLAGGFDAWREHGLPLHQEAISVADPRGGSSPARPLAAAVIRATRE
jgi:3-mercaptopyruvate sulfurtransferase SseA